MERILITAALLILVSLGLWSGHFDSEGVSAQAQAAACNPIPPPPCKEGASPGVIQIMPDASTNKLKLARKRFFLSSCPFNLAASVDVTTAPTLSAFYSRLGAKPELIKWLEDNHCETIYCRALTTNEVNCEGADQKCVPEFNEAYRNALADLKGNAALALKMITNYAPLSDPKLRVGFFEARAEWLKNSVTRIENAIATDYRLRSTITDKDGIGFFYDLCPGSYYVSNVAPVNIDGNEMVWESPKPVNVDGPPNKNDATKVMLAFAASNKKNTIVGKPIRDLAKPKPAGQ
jgi:hypothetical protein